MTTSTPLPAGWPASPIAPSPTLGRPLRQDGMGTLGISTQTLAETALEGGHWDLALELADYYRGELGRMKSRRVHRLVVHQLSRPDTATIDNQAAGSLKLLEGVNFFHQDSCSQ